MRFKFSDKHDYPDMVSITDPVTGKRVYQTPMGPASSVTTILSSLPNPALDAWRERVGPEEAERISKEATTIGSYMHNMLEAYVLGVDYTFVGDPREKMAQQMAFVVRTMGLRKVTEIWGVEVPLHALNLYAGRTDLVCKYNHIPTILDYKSSIQFRSAEMVDKYKLQIAMYSLAHDWMFESLPNYEPIRQGVILIGLRPKPEFGVASKLQTVTIPETELDAYKDKAMQIVEDFHLGKYS